MSIPLPPIDLDKKYAEEEIVKRWTVFPCFYKNIPDADTENRHNRQGYTRRFLRQFLGNMLPISQAKVKAEKNIFELNAQLNGVCIDTRYEEKPFVTGEDLQNFEKSSFPDCYLGIKKLPNKIEREKYSTKWLEVTHEAIKEFFDPRHEVDSMKNDVVEWIESRAIEKGIVSPKATAKAIFTIIKPKDHNPRKRKI